MTYWHRDTKLGQLLADRDMLARIAEFGKAVKLYSLSPLIGRQKQDGKAEDHNVSKPQVISDEQERLIWLQCKTGD